MKKKLISFLFIKIKVILENKLISIRQVFHSVFDSQLKFFQFITSLLLVGLLINILHDLHFTVKEIKFFQVLVVVFKASFINLLKLRKSCSDLVILIQDFLFDLFETLLPGLDGLLSKAVEEIRETVQ